MTAGMAPRLKVVTHKNRIEADLFGDLRVSQKLPRAELFGRRFIPQLEQILLRT
jgi:hypothetical protein